MSTTSIGLPGLVRKSITSSIAPSTLMVVAGFLAIVIPPVAGVSVTTLVAWLLLFSGLMHFMYAWQTPGAVVWETLVGVAYKLVGGYVLFHRVLGLAGLTLVFAIYLFVVSVLDFIVGFQLRRRRGSGSLFVDGIITLILAVLVWRTWPSGTDWAVSILLGISILFDGISRLMFSMAARNLVAQARTA